MLGVTLLAGVRAMLLAAGEATSGQLLAVLIAKCLAARNVGV